MDFRKRVPPPGVPPRPRRTEVVNFSVTEENERPGNVGTRSAPAAPSAVPPKPSAPPTSATPVVPPAAAPARPSAPPASRPDAGRPGPRAAGRGSGTAALAGAGKVATEKAAQLGGWARGQSAARLGAAAAAVVVMGLLIWWLTSLGGSPKQPVADTSPAAAATTTQAAPADRGPLPLEGVGPLDFQPGDCFKDFDPEAQESTVVDCATGHSAQLIAVHHYQASDAYPGLTALKDKGRETCRNAQLAAAATTYNLLQRNAYPSSSSWDNGDRRVDCYVTADAGNVIMETLVP